MSDERWWMTDEGWRITYETSKYTVKKLNFNEFIYTNFVGHLFKYKRYFKEASEPATLYISKSHFTSFLM